MTAGHIVYSGNVSIEPWGDRWKVGVVGYDVKFILSTEEVKQLADVVLAKEKRT